jgi:hypothetical protein
MPICLLLLYLPSKIVPAIFGCRGELNARRNVGKFGCTGFRMDGFTDLRRRKILKKHSVKLIITPASAGRRVNLLV